MTPHVLAVRLRVARSRINEIVNEERRITRDTAVRLARFFNTTPGFWMNPQQICDLKMLAKPLLREIQREVQPYAA